MPQSDRSRRRSQASRGSDTQDENAGQSVVVFMQNRVPADFAGPSGDPSGRRRRSQRQSSGSSDRSEGEESSVPASIPDSSLLEHIATSRFFHHYVSPTRTFFRLDLDFTHSVIDGASKRAILAEAVIAMGILTLPNKSRSAYTGARIRHTRALRRTNKALLDPEYAKSDEMLMAVILLGLYETTPDASHSITSWTSHLDGARHLLRLRGKTLLQNGAAYRMFNVLRQQILLNCFMTMQKVPQDLIDLSNALGDEQDGEEKAASQLVNLFARMCNLVSSVRQSSTPDMPQIIAEATVLDSELVEWAGNIPPGFNITIQPATPNTGAYADTYEDYSSIFSAEVWIIYRTSRLGVNGLLASLYAAMAGSEATEGQQEPEPEALEDTAESSDISLQLQERLSIVDALRVDMCAAIPFLIDKNGESPRAISDLPLSHRTLPVNILMFLTRMQGTGEKMCTWAETLLAELQAEPDVDNGAIWMNNPSAAARETSE